MKWEYTYVWEIDGRLVVANTVEEAVKLFRAYLTEEDYQPYSIQQVATSDILNKKHSALIEKK